MSGGEFGVGYPSQRRFSGLRNLFARLFRR
jgi:hypothetical protein